MRPIKFPRDGRAHDSIIEWWYFNGHLRGEDGRLYSFMDCLFQADTKKVKLPFLQAPFKKTYFSHSILSDIKKLKFYPIVDYISLPSSDSFKRSLFFVNYINANLLGGFTVSVMEEFKPFKYHVKTENFDLILTAVKKPLLEGGNGYLNLDHRSTYYYSLTNLKTEGTIKVGGREIKVKGKSWFDHQWADVSYAKDEWNWFSIQLDNNVELVCFEYNNKGKRKCLADIVYADGHSEHFKKVCFTPSKRTWRSSKTKAKYPLNWQIAIPDKKIILETKPLIKEQEMIFGTINYWEGPLSVKGIFGQKKVSGTGFMELVGRPSHYGMIKFAEETLSQTIKKLRK